VLVTHEPDIAQYADRIIVVRDGRIIRDQQVLESRDAAEELSSIPPVDEQLEEYEV
jgi:putative ABC transport system ATP-binding protein